MKCKFLYAAMNVNNTYGLLSILFIMICNYSVCFKAKRYEK